MPISFSKKFCPNFSSGEKERALSAAITMPSMVFSFGPCMRTVNSEVVGSAPTKELVRGAYWLYWMDTLTIHVHYDDDAIITCIQLMGGFIQPQEVVDHGGLANTPRSQKQHHWFRSDLSIYVKEKQMNYN